MDRDHARAGAMASVEALVRLKQMPPQLAAENSRPREKAIPDVAKRATATLETGVLARPSSFVAPAGMSSLLHWSRRPVVTARAAAALGMPSRSTPLDALVASFDQPIGTVQVDGEAEPIPEGPMTLVPSAARAAAATRLRRGLGILEHAQSPADRDRAAALILDAAVLGDADAQYAVALGDMLLPASRRDAPKATRWLALAANQGHSHAQFALARAYASGEGVRKNAAWAEMWLERAARRGHARAQFVLALRRLVGEAGDADLIEAYRWLAIANDGGIAEATRYRAALGDRLAPADRHRLDLAAESFTPLGGVEAWPDPPLVRYVQRALAVRGHDPGARNGTFGSRTRSALVEFAGTRDVVLTPSLVAQLRER